ncbi:MAG: tyrosine-protein phosphatase [Bacilli bacterium]|nr:tyrosine-protein phosphatase [Bacilli bacterium]
MYQTIENFRDLGVYDCAYGKMTPGVVYRSGTLSYASEEELAKVKQLGIKTIIDLRGEPIRSRCPHPLSKDDSIKIIDVEVPHGEDFAHKEEDVPNWYLKFVSSPYVSRMFFHSLLNARKPVLIHCEAGKDRTGVFSALLLLANGVSKEDVCKDYTLSYDGRLAKTERRTLERVPTLEDFVFHPNPSTFAGFIDLFFETFGSMEGYFEAMEFDEDEANGICNLFGVQEISAGAVVFQGTKVLIEHMAQGHYSMPKGHVEETDEDLRATARREILEETGLSVHFDPKFETRTFFSPRPGHIKEVVWFLAFVESGTLKPQKEEVSDCYFLSLENAMMTLSHNSDRRVLQTAAVGLWASSARK